MMHFNLPRKNKASILKGIASLATVVLLAGCSTLPTSGPTGSQIYSDLERVDSVGSIRIVEVAEATALPPAERSAELSLRVLPPPPTDMVGPGDVLNVTIFEAGVTLFGGPRSSGAGAASGFDPSVKEQALPPSRVDDRGDIVIPYVGKLRVLGSTVDEVRKLIQSRLSRLSQNPQVLVTMREVVTNSVIVSGEVTRPGRLVLQTNYETLSDVVALAGGYRGNARELVLRVTRSGQVQDIRLSDLVENPALDTRVYPGDRLLLISSPQSFSVLGAAGRIEQVPFAQANVSLVQAITSVGGVNPTSGDPAAIFVFRYEQNEKGELVPVVYHVNMMKAQSYFLAQRFMVRDKDVLYFGNAKSNQPGKLVQLISQLFSPILTVTSAVQTVQNSN